jgi:hypothetical protein
VLLSGKTTAVIRGWNDFMGLDLSASIAPAGGRLNQGDVQREKDVW